LTGGSWQHLAMADRDDDTDDTDDDESSEPKPKPVAKKKPTAKNTRKRAEEPKEIPHRKRGEPEQPQSSSSLIWILLAAAALLGGWWLWRGRTAETTPREEPTVRTETPPATPSAPPKASEEPEQPAPTPDEAPAASAAPSASAAPIASAPPPSAGGGSFDRAVALDALAKNAAKAAGCRMRGESAGTANVTVTFEPSGKVKEAEIRSGPFSGSATGKCIVKKLMETTITPFSGEEAKVVAPVSVR
jgi:hypothetical protein